MNLTKYKIPCAKIIRFISFGLLFFVLIYLGYRAYFGLQSLLSQGIEFDLKFVFLSFICQVVGYFFAVGLWSDIIHQLGVKSDYWFDFLAFAVSAIGRKIPGFVIYAVGRLLIYSAIQVSKTLIAIGMIIEMVIYSISGIICLIISSGTALPYPWMNNPMVLASFALLATIGLILLGPKLITLVLKISKNQAKVDGFIGNNPLKFWNLLRWIVVGITVTFFSTGAVYFIFRSVKIPTPIPFSPVLASFGLNFLMGPLAVWIPSDIGLRDGIMYFLIKNWTDPSLAALLTLAARVWISFTEIGLGLIAAFYLNRRINLVSILRR